MHDFPKKTSALFPFAVLSTIGHLLFGCIMGGAGSFDFSAPVSPSSTLSVILEGPGASTSPRTEKAGRPARTPDPHPPSTVTGAEKNLIGPAGFLAENDELPPPATVSGHLPLPSPAAKASIAAPVMAGAPEEFSMEAAPERVEKEGPGAVSVPFPADYERERGPVRRGGEFLTAKRERLTYRITLLKVPVGSAVMDARNDGGELRITLRITSNAVLSPLYPVDDLVETRMIKGNYLLTRVRQKEGNFLGDFGFTLMLREHKAFWVDRLRNRYDYQSLPRDDVMDAVTGFYFLRNRELDVGKKVLLHLFDGNEYSPTTVEVLRRERIELPGSGGVDTLVLHPLSRTAGYFRRSGDVRIWLTDDQYRVPVRLETSIALGKVSFELVSAESEGE